MKKYSVPALDKAFTILDLLAETKKELTITELHTQLNIPKASVFMIMNVLEEHQVVSKDAHGRFTIGVKLFKLGSAYINNLDIAKIARPHLEQLTEETGFTSHLGILDNESILFIDKVESNAFIKFSTFPGMRSDIHMSSLGKAISAFLPEPELERIIANKGLGSYTPNTITRIDEFKLVLERIRENRYAIEDEEGEIGVRCVGAPIFDSNGKIAAAVSITALRTELPIDLFVSVGEKVRIAGMQISKELGLTNSSLLAGIQ